MKKRWRLALIILGVMVFLCAQITIAADPQFKEHQDEMLKEIGLKPGDIINKDNWQKADGLIPGPILAWLKKGQIEIKIGEFKYDVEPEDEWVQAGAKNAGKFALDKNKNLIDAKTGKFPEWMHGRPFPNVDIKNDPDGAIKYMYNRVNFGQRIDNINFNWCAEWIGPDGFERVVENRWLKYFYWGRPKQVPNPRGYKMTHVTAVTRPYNLAGTAQLTLRKIDGTEDEVYTYVPAIRRVKRMSGANRSDPYVGSDATIDDSNGYDGVLSAVKWSFMEEKTGLFLVEDWHAEHWNKMHKLPNGAWESPLGERVTEVGWQDPDWKYLNYMPLHAVWIPRKFVILEGIATDPYYSYGRFVMWIDKNAYWPNYKVAWNQAGEHWKTLIQVPNPLKFGDRHGFQSTPLHIFTDEKMNHTTNCQCAGMRHGRQMVTWIGDPKLTPKTFTVERLRMWTK